MHVNTFRSRIAHQRHVKSLLIRRPRQQTHHLHFERAYTPPAPPAPRPSVSPRKSERRKSTRRSSDDMARREALEDPDIAFRVLHTKPGKTLRNRHVYVRL